MKPKIERRNKMKKNKGFTLIELLAVIVILAIIALIAVPVVMNIIEKANKSSFKDSAYGLLKAGELFYTNQLLENGGNATETTFTFPNNIEGLEFKGSKPSKGSMTVRKDGKVSMAITNGKYCVTKGFEDNDVQIKEDDGNCKGPDIKNLSDLAVEATFTKVNGSAYETPTVTVPSCAKSGVCEQGTPIAIKVNNTETYKFYVLSDTGREVTLIMDRNLGETVEWVSLEDYKNAGGTEEEYGEYGNNNRGPLTALRILKDRTSGWTNIPTYTYTLKNDYDDEYGSNTYSDISVTNVRARLPRLEELKDTEGSCAPDDCVSWLTANIDDYLLNGYWTSTVNSPFQAMAYSVIMGYPGLGIDAKDVDLSTQNGLRPVITLSK